MREGALWVVADEVAHAHLAAHHPREEGAGRVLRAFSEVYLDHKQGHSTGDDEEQGKA